MFAGNPFAALTKFLFFSAVSRFIPESKWLSVARLLAWISGTFRRTLRVREKNHFSAVLGRTLDSVEAQEISIDRSANAFLTAFMIMGQQLSENRSQNIRVQRLENIAAALEAGNGVILWVCPFSYARLIAKVGLHQEGVQVSHLSRESHGFGNSRLAVRYLNQHWVSRENIYLKERLVMAAGNETGALRALRRCLRNNGVVSITLGMDGRKRHSVPFLNGTLTVATGALGLAISTGAAVLPVYALRTSEGGFEVTVEHPLARGPDGGRDAQFDHMVRCLAENLAPLIAQNPGQWSDWDMLQSLD